MSSVRLELAWPNKDKFLLVPKDENGKPVWVEPNHPAAHEVRLTDFVDAVGDVNEEDPYADNLLFSGDGIDVLRVLKEVPEYRRHYRGRVKLIYIDPPFNTGQAFPHYDDWLEHSTWLSFMRDRLVMMRDLLSPSGSIWVHLDDTEVHRMRCLLDEVFGAQNFVATVIWEKTDSPRMDARHTIQYWFMPGMKSGVQTRKRTQAERLTFVSLTPTAVNTHGENFGSGAPTLFDQIGLVSGTHLRLQTGPRFGPFARTGKRGVGDGKKRKC
jgi:hypothetical protein